MAWHIWCCGDVICLRYHTKIWWNDEKLTERKYEKRIRISEPLERPVLVVCTI